MIRSGSIFILLFFSIYITVKGQSSSGSSFAAGTGMSGQDSAYALLEDALELMQKSPFSKLSVTWDELKAAARNQLINASNSTEAYSVINWCAEQAKLNHSFIMPKTKVSIYARDTAALKRTPALRKLVGKIQAEITADGVGYLNIPYISTTDEATCRLLADSLQNLLRKLAKQGAINWIIDLRNNTGGNCWPMLAGMGPLIGEGICGYFVKPERTTSIRYQQGKAWHGNTIMCAVSSPFTLMEEQKKNIVVLTGPRTSSAGEILALAFRGMNNVRFMGEATAGLTTGNAPYTMMDGSMLILSVCREADRKGVIAEGKLQPDDGIPPSTSEDAARIAAVLWLQSL